MRLLVLALVAMVLAACGAASSPKMAAGLVGESGPGFRISLLQDGLIVKPGPTVPTRMVAACAAGTAATAAIASAASASLMRVKTDSFVEYSSGGRAIVPSS